MNEILKNHLEALEEIIDCVDIGIYITDGKGNTLMVNNESVRTGEMTKDQVIGKNVRELLGVGFIKESATLQVLKSGNEEFILQNLGAGGKELITAKPFYRNGKIEFIICTERKITEMKKLEILTRAEESGEEHHKKPAQVQKTQTHGNMVAASRILQNLVDKAVRIAPTDATVILTGESGTGKEVFANLIYQHSNRVEKPFIKVNCAAIPESLVESEFFGYEKGAFTGAEQTGKIGIFELADQGTLLLDEIGELPVQMQSKLLAVIQDKKVRRLGGKIEKKVDFRLIAATNQDIHLALRQGRFREDLYYLLNIIPIQIPPLRERKADIEVLALHFVSELGGKHLIQKTLSLDGLTVLNAYDWPGNVRELRNVIERVMISFDGKEITGFQIKKIINAESVSYHKEFEEGASLEELMEAHEKEILSYMMNKYGTASTVCQKLKTSKATMSRKLKKYGIR